MINRNKIFKAVQKVFDCKPQNTPGHYRNEKNNIDVFVFLDTIQIKTNEK